MEQWFEFKDRKVGLAAALTRYPPTRLETGVAHIGPTLRLSSHPPPIPMRVDVGGPKRLRALVQPIRQALSLCLSTLLSPTRLRTGGLP
jgi:hypothetical protein